MTESLYCNFWNDWHLIPSTATKSNTLVYSRKWGSQVLSRCGCHVVLSSRIDSLPSTLKQLPLRFMSVCEQSWYSTVLTWRPYNRYQYNITHCFHDVVNFKKLSARLYQHSLVSKDGGISGVISFGLILLFNQWLKCDSFVFAVYYFPWIHVWIFPVYGILVFCYEI